MKNLNLNNDVIKKLFPPSATEEDIRYCLAVAEEHGLSPIKREIMFIERKQIDKTSGKWITKIEPLVGRDGFLSLAHKTGQFAGMETTVEIKETPALDLEKGEWVYKKDLVARCTVYRKDSDKPFVVEVAYSEYVQTKSDGTPTNFWLTKPKTMLGKVAESQCLRKAFNISGIYSAEEIGYGSYADNGELIEEPVEAEEPVAPASAEEPEPVDASCSNDANEELFKALQLAGVKYEVKDGWVGVKNGYKHKELLTQLGFSYVASKKYYVLRL